MKMTVIDKAIESFPDTTAADWRMVGEAAVHKSVTPRDNCRFLGPAILRGGVFYRGIFHGGIFQGGKFHGGYFNCGYFNGGEFHGGEFRGGYFHGGEFRGGVFYSGVFHGGEFHGGVFHGGNFRGGIFNSGTFYGGKFRGGVFTVTPVQLFEILPWSIVVQGEGDGRIAIGCECHSMADWFLNGEDICKEHDADWVAVQAALAIVQNLIPAGNSQS